MMPDKAGQILPVGIGREEVPLAQNDAFETLAHWPTSS